MAGELEAGGWAWSSPLPHPGTRCLSSQPHCPHCCNVLHPPTHLLQGVDLTDEELVDHISEMCVMSKSLEEYEGEGPQPG
jgi:hypothetical protein